jgi:hypothetical protein
MQPRILPAVSAANWQSGHVATELAKRTRLALARMLGNSANYIVEFFQSVLRSRAAFWG